MQVADVVPSFADAFPFETFNRMQQAVIPAILQTEDNVVVSAPTASGKTALAELAICEVLEAGGTAVFLAPLRALTNEKESEWERFESLGYSVYVVTGERDLDPRRAERADVLVMTPEKADSATRKHDSPRYGFIEDVDLCVIDEVHLLDAADRGAVLEVTVARLRRLSAPRIVALSATMRNIDDVAEWLDAPPATTFEFGSEYRPVDLSARVETYTHGENAWADKYRRLYRALDLAEPHLADGQALIFVASRQDTVRAAEKARDEAAQRDLDLGARGEYEFHQDTEVLENQTLRKSVIDGVAFHHAGLSRADKTHVERWFREGMIDILFSTSTLAWGVNLPARCVVIRDTKLHDPLEGEVDMSPLDVLQMLGRAGRPEYDDEGFAYLIAGPEDADRYRRLLREGADIESRLAARLPEHLNAEIAMGTLHGLGDVMDWLEGTFYYVRAQSDPQQYGFTDLRDRVRDVLEDLVDRDFVQADDDLGLSATPLGRLTSNYYIELATAERFRGLPSTPGTADVLRAIADAAAFDSVSARSDETDAIDAIVDAPAMDDGARKVLAILRGAMRGEVPPALRSDAWVIQSNARRLLAALQAFCREFRDPFAENLVVRVDARIETGVPADAVGLTAIDGIGAGRAQRLAEAGMHTPTAVLEADVDGLVAAGLSEALAERIHRRATTIPRVSIDWGSFPDRIGTGERDFREVEVSTMGDGGRVGIRVTVDDVEMTRRETYLDGTTTIPVGVFGAAAGSLTYEVSVALAEEPIAPLVEQRTVTVD
ncbi:MAG: DEAD/DEAH box helicase [Halobacteriaceae archaeon]